MSHLISMRMCHGNVEQGRFVYASLSVKNARVGSFACILNAPNVLFEKIAVEAY